MLAAAGSTLGASATSGPLIEHWDGAAWTPVSAPGAGQLTSVAALSPSDAWAVGTHLVGVCDQPVADHWDGSSWQAVAMPVMHRCANAGFAHAPVLAAFSTTDVWAFGGRLIERWNGTRWRILPSPKRGDIAAGAVLSPNNAWAVGSYGVSFHPKGKPCCESERSRTLVLHWNGSAWKEVTSPNPSYANPRGARRYDDLFGLAAASPRSVWAVGDYFESRAGHHSYQTLVLHWNGKAWKRAPSPDPGGIRHDDYLYSVTVAARNDVWAVGGYHNGHDAELPLVEHWNGHRWAVVPAPPGDPYSSEQQLTDISADSPDDVWAAGWYLHDNNVDLVGQTLTEHWDGSSWTQVPSSNPDFEDTFDGVAATSPSDVWAVGGYYNP